MDLDFAPALLPQLAGVTTSTSDQSPGIVGKVLVSQRALSTVAIDTYVNRPGASTVQGGSLYYATDQAALYLTDGTTWTRVGAQPGDIIWTNETAARTGYVLLNGAAWPATTGIYTELFALWGGANLPDIRGRMPVAIGTHADVATILNSDGDATVAHRRPKHRTTNALTGGGAVTSGGQSADHTHLAVGSSGSAGGEQGINAGIVAQSGGAYAATHGTSNDHTHTVTPNAPGGSIGTNVANDPLDSSSYLVLQPQAKL